MNIWKSLAGLTALVFLSGCSVYSQPAKPVSSNLESNLLVSGEIVPITDEKYVYKGESIFTEDAHAVVTLSQESGVVDGVIKRPELASETQRIEGIGGFPIPFRLEGNPKKFFARPSSGYGSPSYHTISATVYMGAGEKLYVGDFVTDILFEVDGPTSDMKIRVSGLEDCNSPNAGGACVENRRP